MSVPGLQAEEGRSGFGPDAPEGEILSLHGYGFSALAGADGNLVRFQVVKDKGVILEELVVQGKLSVIQYVDPLMGQGPRTAIS